MATIVTMDSKNVVVVSPSNFEDSEPELVHESIHFCLDGTQQQQRQQQQQQQPSTDKNSKPPPLPPSSSHDDDSPQSNNNNSNHHVEFVLEKGMNTDERRHTDSSRTTDSTATTTDTTQSTNTFGSNNNSPGGIGATSSSLLASPVTILSKYSQQSFNTNNSMTDSPYSNIKNNNSNSGESSQVPIVGVGRVVHDRNVSNISLQDMYENDDDDQNQETEGDCDSDGSSSDEEDQDAQKKEGETSSHDKPRFGEEVGEHDHFYLDQQTPPTVSAAPQNNQGHSQQVLPPPSLMSTTGLGTPPITLYAPPPAVSTGTDEASAAFDHPLPGSGSGTSDNNNRQQQFQQQQQQQQHQHQNPKDGRRLLSADSMSSEVSNTSRGLSVSPAGPVFPMDGNTPPSHRPMLYSAIGSLETCGAHSLKSMWHNNKANQQKPAFKFDSSTLIAPSQQRQQQQKQRTQTGNNNDNNNRGNRSARESNLTIKPSSSQEHGKNATPPSQQSTPDKFGDHRTSAEGEATGTSTATTNKSSPSFLGTADLQPTPATAHHQSAFEASLRSVQEKIDARQNVRTRHSTSNNKHKTTTTTPSSSQATATAKDTANKQVAANTTAVAASAGGGSKNLKQPIASSMRNNKNRDGTAKKKINKSVKIDDASLQRKSRSKKPIEMFRPSCDAYTPRMERKKIAYKPAEMRTPVQKMATTMGTLSRPNFRDALRRVAMLIRQHIVKIEQRFNSGNHNSANNTIKHRAKTDLDEGLFRMSMKDAFCEDRFVTCRYKCTVVRVPMARPGMVFGLKKIRPQYKIPTEEEIYEFAHQLFKTVQLSSECSIVCLIYIERLMEISKVPLLASTWKPIFMCGLLLASKVWQDLSSWNIEFASVYPQFSLDAINKLELQFLRMLKWDLYVSSSLYAKYYFALRSLVEKPDFRQRYNRMVGGVDSVAASEALKIQKRTEQVKEEALMQLSRSM